MNAMKKTGFSLFELMVVVAIVAILAAIAIPSYQDSVRKSRRAESQSQLIAFAGVAELMFTQSTSYATVALTNTSDFYSFSFTVAVTATTYTVKATPISSQTVDGCGSMTLTNTGIRAHTGSEAHCWRE